MSSVMDRVIMNRSTAGMMERCTVVVTIDDLTALIEVANAAAASLRADEWKPRLIRAIDAVFDETELVNDPR